MRKLGTIKALCAAYDLHHELIPRTLADVRVVENRRLSRAAGRFCQLSFGPMVIDRWIDIHPAVLTLPELYREVLGHEVAHAIVPNESHSFKWAMVCRSLGGPARTHIPTELCEKAGMNTEYPVRAVCQRCHFELRKARPLNPRKTFGHRACGGRFVNVEA